ncbi:MAG: SH3 domain-containing protein [Spirochaetales bacterium]|nr:SH3 domain-containing protein [Spirochaetales bacterium]
MKKIITVIACFALIFFGAYSQTDAEKQESYKLFQAAIKTKDTSKLVDIFNFKLTPDYYQDNWEKPVIVMIADTKDSDFILSCLKAIDKSYGIPYPSYSGKNNPLTYFVINNDAETVRKVLEWKKELSDFCSYNGQSYSLSPLAEAVNNDYIDVAKVIIPYVSDVNDAVCVSYKDKNFGKSYQTTCNLLSYARSDEMKKLLLDAGIKTYIPYTRDFEKTTYVIDDKVNIRDSAGLSGKKIGQLNNGDEVEVLGVDAAMYTIDNYHGHWINIKYADGKTGYIFEKYLYQFEQ